MKNQPPERGPTGGGSGFSRMREGNRLQAA